MIDARYRYLYFVCYIILNCWFFYQWFFITHFLFSKFHTIKTRSNQQFPLIMPRLGLVDAIDYWRKTCMVQEYYVTVLLVNHILVGNTAT